MAVFGRRQPHAPLVLRGQLPAQPPVGVVRVVGQRTGQAAADRAFRRSFPPILVRGGGPPAMARPTVVQRQSQSAARRPQGRAAIVRGGGLPAVGRSLVVQRVAQPAARRPQGNAVVVRGGGLPAVGRSLLVQRVSQPASRRPQGRATSIKGGGQPAVGRSALTTRQSQPAGRRPQSRLVVLGQPLSAPPPTTAPVGVAVVVGRAAQLAARRPASKVLVVKAGGRPAVGRTTLLLQATRAAADRYYRRGFPAIVRRPGAPPAVGLLRLFGRTACTAAADRFYRPSGRVRVVPVVTPSAGGGLLLLRRRAVL